MIPKESLPQIMDGEVDALLGLKQVAIKEVGKLEPIYQSNSTGLILFSTGFKNIAGYQSLAVGGVIPRISPRTTQLTTVAGVEGHTSDQTKTTEAGQSPDQCLNIEVAGVKDTTSDQTKTTEAGQSLDQCFKRSIKEKT